MILPLEERRLNDYPILLQNAIRNGEMSEKSSRNHCGPLGIGGQLPSELKSPPPVLSLVFFVGEVIEITFSFRFRMADIQEQVGSSLQHEETPFLSVSLELSLPSSERSCINCFVEPGCLPEAG